jgi:hypothetical protein
METPEQIEARLRLEYPIITVVEGNTTRPLSPEEYEVTLAEWVSAEQARQERESISAVASTQREQIKQLYTALQEGTATNLQVQKTVAWLLKQEIREL